MTVNAYDNKEIPLLKEAEKMKETPEKIIDSVKTFFKKTVKEAPLKKTAAFFKNISVKTVLSAKEKIIPFVLKWWHWMLGAVFALMVLYYPAGALLYHRIDINPPFGAKTQEASVQTLNTLAELIGRETDQYAFTPNLPFFFPAAVLDNMPAFQTGIITAIQKITQAFAVADPQSEPLKKAADLLAYPVNVWHVDQWKPAVSSVKKYRTAGHLISEYAAQEQADRSAFDPSARAAEIIINHLVADLKECIAALNTQISAGEDKIWDTQADNVFYEVKGQAYVYFLMLRDMETDFKNLFLNEALKNKAKKALSALETAVRIQPMIVVNGAAETQFLPNHLSGAGFYLARAALDLTDMAQMVRQVENE